MSSHSVSKQHFSDYTEAEFLHCMEQILGTKPHGRDRQAERLLNRFAEVTEYPDSTDLIFWPEDGSDTSAKGITDIIRQWREANGLPGFKAADPDYQPPRHEPAGSMGIDEVKKLLVRPAAEFVVSNSPSTDQVVESWIGKVSLYGLEEGVPKNDQGVELHPYAQLHLDSLPFKHPLLEGVSVITLFVAEPLPEAFEPMGNNWLIREYGPDNVLVPKELPVAGSTIKAVSLKVAFVAEDFPLWDEGGIPTYLDAEIVELERSGQIESYEDLGAHAYGHKVGGYPSFCQPGIDPGEDFEFVFQLSSDPEINLNVVDSGSLMFWKSKVTGEWVLYYDFY